MKQKQIYYSHSMQIYNSDRELEELDFIRSRFPGAKIINPNGDLIWQGSMEPYLRASIDSDLVICSEFRGCIGRGVFEEVRVALEIDEIVLCICKIDNKYCFMEVEKVIENNTNDWKVEYGLLILKGGEYYKE